MYSYTFYYFRILFERFSKKRDRSFDAVAIIFLMQLFQLLLINACIKFLFDFSLFQNILTNDYFRNKVVFMPFLIIWILLLYWYFTKKWQKIEAKYTGRVSLDLKNSIIILFLIVLPSVLACYLSFHK